ncbi:hypothetical protein WICPIJ_000515 [Wickerhamomyces pijperi]|uniref:Uncharacterized protein n=1 Tax=Wickerhamomyces pijperi TaxID=599730 RepID=A0A9P8QDH2_WICPI|nr:hypothetical protein WICPIJ_000515 [Wickerhamomyces pijperi]
MVSTAVNNKWKTRTVTIFENQFYLNNSETRKDNNNNTDITQEEVVEAEQPKIDFSKSAIAIVPFVGFMVRACDSFAELVDVQTGVLIMKFPIREFKKNSFKVFHDQPTHCRFCGSASISSFSVVYTLLGTNTVVLHTFRVDHRAKKSICLRVERDVREIRCIGFNSVSQDIYELENVECWSATDNNQIIGVSKKIEEVIRIDDSDSDSDSNEIDAHLLRRRRGGEPKLKSRDTLAEPSTTPDLWKGWTMTADGKIDYYDIPQNGDSEGLLVNSISQMNKFGHKSIVVAFGNIMKVLYLGNDDLIYTDDNQRPPVNEEISGLSFVNKRRKNLKKDTVNSPLGALGAHDSFNEF